MANVISAGLLMFRRKTGVLQVLLAHPGGPFFAKKDAGCWSIPKGLVEAGEDLLQAACREFGEETGLRPDSPEYIPLGSIEQKGGKAVYAWAFEGEWPEGQLPASNTFRMQWPPRSGRMQEFPEIDRAEMFAIKEAHEKINPRQATFLERLVKALSQ